MRHINWRRLLQSLTCSQNIYASGSPICFSRHFHLSSPWLSNLWIGPPKLGGHVWSFKEKERMSSLWPGIHFASQLRCWNLKWQSLWFVIANRIRQFPSSSNMHNFLWSWECPSRTPTTSTICITVTLCAIELNLLNLLSFNNCKPWSSSECTCYLDVPKSNTNYLDTYIFEWYVLYIWVVCG
jgi:hypothetical protein